MLDCSGRPSAIKGSLTVTKADRRREVEKVRMTEAGSERCYVDSPQMLAREWILSSLQKGRQPCPHPDLGPVKLILDFLLESCKMISLHGFEPPTLVICYGRK